MGLISRVSSRTYRDVFECVCTFCLVLKKVTCVILFDLVLYEMASINAEPDPDKILVKGELEDVLDIEPTMEPNTPSPTVSQLPLSSPMGHLTSHDTTPTPSPLTDEQNHILTENPTPTYASKSRSESPSAVSEGILSPSNIPIPESPATEQVPAVANLPVAPTIKGDETVDSVSQEDTTMDVDGEANMDLEKQETQESSVKLEAPHTPELPIGDDTEADQTTLGLYTFHGVDMKQCDIDFTGTELTPAAALSYSQRAHYRPLAATLADDRGDTGYQAVNEVIPIKGSTRLLSLNYW